MALLFVQCCGAKYGQELICLLLPTWALRVLGQGYHTLSECIETFRISLVGSCCGRDTDTTTAVKVSGHSHGQTPPPSGMLIAADCRIYNSPNIFHFQCKRCLVLVRSVSSNSHERRTVFGLSGAKLVSDAHVFRISIAGQIALGTSCGISSWRPRAGAVDPLPEHRRFYS